MNFWEWPKAPLWALFCLRPTQQALWLTELMFPSDTVTGSSQKSPGTTHPSFHLQHTLSELNYSGERLCWGVPGLSVVPMRRKRSLRQLPPLQPLPRGLIRVASTAFPPSPQRASSKGKHCSPVPATTSEFPARSLAPLRDLTL